MRSFAARILAGMLGASLLAGTMLLGPVRAKGSAGEVSGSETAVLPDSSYMAYAGQTESFPDGSEEREYLVSAGEEHLEAGGQKEFVVSLAAAGRYRLELEYLAQSEQGQSPAVTILLDGKLPFEQSGGLSLDTIWVDDGTAQADSQGNAVHPPAREESRRLTMILRDNSTVHDGELLFALPAGETRITVQSAGPLALYGIRLLPPETLLSYAQVSAGYPEIRTVAAWETEAENMLERSDSAIRRQSDQSDPSVAPSNARSLTLNTLGGENWQQPGQWVSWRLEVPEDGLYTLSFRYRQDIIPGLPSFRQLKIDGEIPFSEMRMVAFPYSSDWRTMTLADEQGAPYLFYLEQGSSVLTLSATLGAKSEYLPELQNAVYFMNEIYRDIIMVTGVSVDLNRDFQFEYELPDLLPNLEKLREQLEEIRRVIGTMQTGGGDEASSVLGEIVRQVDGFLKRPSRIPQRLERFRTNISTLSDILSDLQKQPLELDQILLVGNGSPVKARHANVLEKIWFRIQILGYTFMQDYSFGETGSQAEPLKVWINTGDILSSGVASGRDQAQILKTLIAERFTPESHIPVNLTLTNVGDSLMQASLSGVGPDAAVFVPEATPVYLALRDVAADLSSASDFPEIREWFYPSAWIPYTLSGVVYALPETQNYYMLFYRTDIFESMGLVPPKTWDEFLDVTVALQKKNLEVGVPENQAVFEMLLLQQGGAVFNDQLTSVTLTTPEAIAAFTSWTDLYSQYGLPLYFDFFNRFRSGEMPMGLASLSFYNQVSIAAPELRGLWSMVPIPGEAGETGINHAQSAGGTGTVVLQGDRADDAYTFAKWWVSADVQYAFGKEMELLLGKAARYHTANRQAFERIPWTQEERLLISQQWEQVTDIPQSPASYYISRSLTNAFRAVLYNSRNPRETMLRYTADMQKELERKNTEFDLVP